MHAWREVTKNERIKIEKELHGILKAGTTVDAATNIVGVLNAERVFIFDFDRFQEIIQDTMNQILQHGGLKTAKISAEYQGTYGPRYAGISLKDMFGGNARDSSLYGSAHEKIQGPGIVTIPKPSLLSDDETPHLYVISEENLKALGIDVDAIPRPGQESTTTPAHGASAQPS